MAIAKLLEREKLNHNGTAFVIAMWLLSRLVLLVAMLAIAPALPAPPGGDQAHFSWEAFNAWDGRQFEVIATKGYEFVKDGKAHNIAFLPLFPLLVRGVMLLGLPFDVAGTLVNNFTFLAAAILLYGWVEERHGSSAARWIVATFLWCPFSIFGTVIYTEGCFLLCTIAALRSFERGHYGWAGFWGALGTAIRLPALALIPTFIWIAWRQRRPLAAYLAAAATLGGLLAYMVYCWLRFGEPLAFYLAHMGWTIPNKLKMSWLWVLLEITIGPRNAERQALVDPWHPLIFLLLIALALALWNLRRQWGNVKTGYGFWLLGILLWLLAGSPLINALMVWGGGYLLWHCRRELSPVALTYAVFSFAIIFAAGRTGSAERYAYGIPTLSIALGLLLQRYPRHGYLAIGFLAILLASFGVRFAQQLWVG
jgi:Gpi18-like mannosyltransferase